MKFTFNGLLGDAELSGTAARFLPLMIGVILLTLISSVPYVGRLAARTVSLLGFGAFWISCRALPFGGTAERATGQEAERVPGQE